MKSKLLPIFTFIFCYSTAQTLVTDSVVLQPGITHAVFYQLSSGAKSTVVFNDWHIAVSVRPSQFPNNPLGSTTIRINEAYGTAAYYVPNTTSGNFGSALDTTGWQGWWRLHDSDSSINEGALNQNRNMTNPFDFGWGVYNVSTHNLVGDSIYLLQLPDGSFKKLWVEKLVYDTAYTIRTADVDGSNAYTFSIVKNGYAGKNFVYLNLLTNEVYDKEPLATDWDLMFLKYASRIQMQGTDTFYAVTGVWLNEGISSGELHGADVLTANAGAATYSYHMSGIGYDWKWFNNGTFQYEVEDSLVYFVLDRSGSYYRLVMQYFGGSSNGLIRFGVAQTVPTGLEEQQVRMSVYPNPFTNTLFIELSEATTVNLSTLNGMEVMRFEGYSGQNQVDLSGVPVGIYVIHAGKWVGKVFKR